MQQLGQLAAVPGFTIYLASLVVLGGLAALDIVRGNAGRAFAWVVVVLLAALCFRFGEDFRHHLHRIAVVAEELRNGTPSLLVINRESGEALPLFVYYSFVPYLPAVVLDLAGLPAHAALRLTMGLELIVLALGVARLIHVGRRREDTNAGFLAAILFLCANYVHNLWLVRQAYAEIWVYCLIPWVTLTLLRRRAVVPLAALLFLQMTGHPLVFAQAFGCALLIAWAFSKESPVAVLTRYAAAAAIALVLATPFWLPQVLWQALIKGPAALAHFADEFLSPGDVVGWRSLRGMGFALPIAVVLMVVLARGRLPARAWVLLAAVSALVTIQTRPLLPLAQHLPLLPTSLFIWRLMLPAALLALAALLVGWRTQPTHNAVLAGLALFSLVSLEVTLAGRAPRSLKEFATFSQVDWLKAYRATNRWGRLEFLPNYAALPRHCGEVQKALFADLRHGVRATSAYVAVTAAPLAGLDYSVDGKTAPLAACDDDLVIGPLAPGAEVRASESALTLVLQARLAALALCLIGLLAWELHRRRALRPQAA